MLNGGAPGAGVKQFFEGSLAGWLRYEMALASAKRNASLRKPAEMEDVIDDES